MKEIQFDTQPPAWKETQQFPSEMRVPTTRFVLKSWTLLPKVKVEVVIGNIDVDEVIEAAKRTLYTGHIGDGKIFVYSVDKVVKIRTGEEDLEALKDVE